MLTEFVKKNKYLALGILFLLLASGAVSKFVRGRMIDVYLNGGLAVIVLIVMLFFAMKDKRK
ncbi:hypothetical protein H1230_18420 [Paenibacillus sp. 19GGS1-52]|uniref:hypothetical protein n=1 Tax=Paenibacillus sp. 19GGS1-52 TaxID=2758563 RepID=UPI001EFBC198|nr:hypothetical protein [Paenibacillus sp. 19GGS1-52]ULO05089.1 hypothetical protein H1230_18420 [Paenibacillus sp. 19GGS1-52]